MTRIKQNPSKEERDDRQKWLNTIFIKSKFKFLQSHNGIRPCALHGLVSTTGAGKTSLLQTLIAEVAEQFRCFIFMSEETTTTYSNNIFKVFGRSPKRENLSYLEERDMGYRPGCSQEEYLRVFSDRVLESNADVVFIDNLTTSKFYSDSLGPEGQEITTEYLKDAPKKLEVPIIYAIHTKSDITDNHFGLIGPQDVRGNKAIANKTEFMYIMQRFTIDKTIYTLVRVVKHREYPDPGDFYLLEWRDGGYYRDAVVPFSTINDIFIRRNRLGRKQ